MKYFLALLFSFIATISFAQVHYTTIYDLCKLEPLNTECIKLNNRPDIEQMKAEIEQIRVEYELSQVKKGIFQETPPTQTVNMNVNQQPDVIVKTGIKEE